MNEKFCLAFIMKTDDIISIISVLEIMKALHL